MLLKIEVSAQALGRTLRNCPPKPWGGHFGAPERYLSGASQELLRSLSASQELLRSLSDASQELLRRLSGAFQQLLRSL